MNTCTIIGILIIIMNMTESAKPQKNRICDHLIRSRDGSSKYPNTKKTGRNLSIIDGCYISLVCLLKIGA